MSIPVFPTFKLLEISDRSEIESHTQRFQPYSDFHFTILWSWDIHEPVLLSLLHGNLVIFHSDCVTTKSCYSVIGTNMIPQTIRGLSDYSITMHGECVIKWLPEETFQLLNGSAYVFSEDVNSFDYIYDVKKLFNTTGSDLASYRRKINHFTNTHTDYNVSCLNVSDITIQNRLIKFFHNWMLLKNEKTKQFNSGFELQAFRKLMHTANYFPGLTGLGLFVGDQLQAFAVVDVMNTSFACIPFIKSNHECQYASQFLMKEVITFLNQQDIRYINFEPDLGIPSLRLSKQCYKPIMYLKKYSIETKD